LLHTTTEVPLVAVEAGPEEAVPVIEVDQHRGAALATRHLLGLGHRTVWHVGGPADFLESRQRLEGWRDTLRGAGAAVPEPVFGDWSPASGYEAGRALGGEAGVTAIFVANDQMALGVLRALHESGRRVPEDVSVVGFDDIPEAAYFMPPLTTIRQDFDEMGTRSLRLLLATIEEGRPQPSAPRVEPRLIVRESTAEAR
jgi:DNA-binding LacI/PurR family transcriptional regulator